ncbi:MAG: hypothetical protein D6683_04930 [Actinomyces sp.]|nr:MAG: hypothetical protein D6683_04930 [Actinomyces sp.]
MTGAVVDPISDDDAAVVLLNRAADAVVAALAGQVDWGPSGRRAGQYASDLAADAAALEVLHAAGARVLSEESGLDPGEGPIVVVDPLDGSTNASRGLPWFATSLCLVDERGPRAAVVHDLAAGRRFEAVRGAGARLDGRRLERAPGPATLEEALVGVNAVPPPAVGWAQFRCFGALALDLCAVAEGRFDAYADFDDDGHGVWDLLGGSLVCTEVGLTVVDVDGRPLAVADPAARRTLVAGPEPLVAALLAAHPRRA